ncbi:MAG: caspase family protein, partial [Sinomicrobium sp.]|nr:caspase family protein [Sinomicrobium sp.]
MPRLYALLVAIDDYPAPVPPLGGCVNDIRKVKAYLEEEQQKMQPDILVLEDAAATKAAIIAGFREHLAKAWAEDTALFYFAGHGTQEEADPELWPFESDQKLECIVNYDGVSQTENGLQTNLLADKELRYLLHELAKTQAHIVTIFDCCHSGSNSREVELPKTDAQITLRRYVNSRLTTAVSKRSWEQFLFSDIIRQEDLRQLPLSRVIPAGQHVHMSACRSDQQAYEVNGGGLFTSTLLELLRDSKGELSYFDLRNRIRYMVKSEYKQTPEVYVQGNESYELFSGFLGEAVERQLNEANFVYNKKEGWVLDMGAMHGLSPDLKTIEIQDAEGGAPFQAK